MKDGARIDDGPSIKGCHSVLEVFLADLGALLDHLGANLPPSWFVLAARCLPTAKMSIFPRVFNDFRARPDLIMGPLGASWGHLGVILGPSWAILGHLGTILRKRSSGFSCPLRAFAKMEASCSRNPIFCKEKQRFYNPLPPHKRGPGEAILRIKREW